MGVPGPVPCADGELLSEEGLADAFRKAHSAEPSELLSWGSLSWSEQSTWLRVVHVARCAGARVTS